MGNALILPVADPASREVAVAALRQEEIIAFPTDTVYGVGGDALSAAAAARTQTAKGRQEDKGLPVLLASAGQVAGLARAWPEAAEALATRFWPGALTIVVAARPGVPAEVRASETVALRVPAHEALRALIQEAGTPLIGTSANRASEPAAHTAQEAALALGASVAVVLDGGRADGLPSTVVSVVGDGVHVLRLGAVSTAALAAALRPTGVRLEGP